MQGRSGVLISALLIGATILLGVLAIVATADAEGLPDLTLSRKGPTSVTALTTFAETVKITNRGSAAATAQAQLNLVGHTVLDAVTVVQPPLPGAPTGLQATRVGDRLQVGWTPAGATKADITSTSITATPVGETAAPVLTGSQGGAATTGTVGPAVPNTTYRITLVSHDAAGASPESAAIEYTTPPSSVLPGPPVELHTWWLIPTTPTGSFLVDWVEGPNPGDSPVDGYQIQAVPAETEVASTLTNTEPASSSETEFTGNSETPWTIRVRAHNAAGWGAWTAPLALGGL